MLTHKRSQYFTPCICQLWTRFVCGGNIHKSKLSSVPYTYCESVVQNTTEEDPPRWSPRISTGWFNSLKSLGSFFFPMSFVNTHCKPSLRYPPFLSWNNPPHDSSYSLCMDDNSAESREKISVSDSHLENSLRVAWPWGFPSVPLSGFEDGLLISRGKRPHAKNNSCYVRCTLLSCWTRGKFDNTELWVCVWTWCAHLPCQTLPWALFSIPSRTQCIRWETLERKDNVGAVMPSPWPQSCLLPLFFPICSETPRSSNFTFLFILDAAISYPTLRIHLQKIIQCCSFSVVCCIVIFPFFVYKSD